MTVTVRTQTAGLTAGTLHAWQTPRLPDLNLENWSTGKRFTRSANTAGEKQKTAERKTAFYGTRTCTTGVSVTRFTVCTTSNILVSHRRLNWFRRNQTAAQRKRKKRAQRDSNQSYKSEHPP
jgi:hypothetical protein